jgi:hypothetical protein
LRCSKNFPTPPLVKRKFRSVAYKGGSGWERKLPLETRQLPP